MKKLFLAVLIGIMGLASCSKDDPGNQTQNLRWSQVDLTGAKYLVLSENPVSKSTGAPSDVFKVDENGNMTAVVFYFTYDNNGNSQQARSDVKVVPQKISSYDGGQYMLLHDCDFRDGQGQSIYLPHYGGSYNFLIRRKDGAVFHIPYSEKDKFPATNSKYTAKVDHNGDLFVCKSSVISKVEAKDGQTYLRQITPNGIGADQFVLTDQTDVLIGAYSAFSYSGTIFYPNGGFEKFSSTRYGYDANGCTYFGETSFFLDGNQLKLIERRSKYDVANQLSTDTLGIRNVAIGSAPPIAINKEYSHCRIQSWSDNSSQEERAVNFVGSSGISCKDHFVLINEPYLLVCNRNDNGTRVFVPDEYPEIINDGKPLEDKIINNVLFGFNSTTRTIQKYNFETLTYSEVQYDDSSVGQYVQLGISLGYNAYIINGVRNSDGRSVVIEIDHSTGAVKTTVAPDERKITELIQLN